MVLRTLVEVVKIHSVKAILIVLISLLALISIAGITSAFYDDKISEVANSGILSDKYMTGLNSWTNDLTQFYYQKFTTAADTVALRQIQLWLPSNITTFNGYLRIGIAKSTNGVLTYTPAQWYALGTWTNGFKCYADIWSMSNKGGFKNLTIYLPSYPSSMYLEPNSNYYITWYIWGPYQLLIPSFQAYMPRGFGPGVFGITTIHRGNVTSAVWTDAYSKYQLGYTLWGQKVTCELNGGVTLVDEGNASIYEIVNDGSSWGRTWTWGTWLGNTTTTSISFETNTTFYTSSTTCFKHYTFTGLLPGKFYHVRPWILKNSSYSVTTGTELHFMTNPTPISNLINISRDSNGNTALTWTKGTGFDTVRTVIFKSLTGYVANPYASTETKIYNDTGNAAVLALGSEKCYLTIYSFVGKTEDGAYLEKYSLNSTTLLDLPGSLKYHVNISNEKTPFGKNGTAPANYWNTHTSSLEATGVDGEVNYLNYGIQSNSISVTCNDSALLTFRLNVNGTGPKDNTTMFERNHIIPITTVATDRNMTIYVPNVKVGTAKGQTKPVTIFLRDRTGGLYTLDQHPQIFIYANGEKNYASKDARDIHSDYVQADYAGKSVV